MVPTYYGFFPFILQSNQPLYKRKIEMKKLTAFLMTLAMVATMSAFAQDAEVAVEENNEKNAWIPGVELSAKWASRYMCDGAIVNPDPCAFLDAYAAWDCGLYLDLWAAMDLNHFNRPDHGSYSYDNNRRGRAEEIDYAIGYNYTYKKLDFSDVTFDVSWKYFRYPKAYFKHDNPLDTTISLDNVFKNNENLQDHSLKLAATWRYDLKHYTNYGWLEATYKYDFNEKLTGKLSSKVFYCGQQKAKNSYGVKHDCFSSLEVEASLSYAITKQLSATTFVDGGWALEEGVRDVWKDSSVSNAFNVRYGVSMAYSF